MAAFSKKAIIFGFLMFLMFTLNAQETAAGNGPISSYLIEMYKNWTNKSGPANPKIPFNATVVQAMYFAPIRGKSSNPLKLTVDIGKKKGAKLTRDELHIYIIKPANSPNAQTFTIKITDSQSKKMMASRKITLQTSGWITISLNLSVQAWFDSGKGVKSLTVELVFENAIANGHKEPRIATGSAKRPYLIIYMD
ncbi:uncharacterized protein LOC114533303 [Dendronephthya gigantea]|uniref:uncharacterized protein LOC114533303 n=1 Tax=Dendronephthya gigantea TaxID=151771 RepID=UPI00106AD322|nr:uncharacterized protein LOC114533303 [Dendronephthya gigantea]